MTNRECKARLRRVPFGAELDADTREALQRIVSRQVSHADRRGANSRERLRRAMGIRDDAAIKALAQRFAK